MGPAPRGCPWRPARCEAITSGGRGPSAPLCRLDRCELSSACGAALGSVVGTSPALTELGLAGNKALGDEGVRLLCEGLRRGAGPLRELR